MALDKGAQAFKSSFCVGLERLPIVKAQEMTAVLIAEGFLKNSSQRPKPIFRRVQPVNNGRNDVVFVRLPILCADETLIDPGDLQQRRMSFFVQNTFTTASFSALTMS